MITTDIIINVNNDITAALLRNSLLLASTHKDLPLIIVSSSIASILRCLFIIKPKPLPLDLNKLLEYQL